MFENTLQTNGTQSWKWVTITGRVFVDNADLEAADDHQQGNTEQRTADGIFEDLARDRLIEALPHSHDPFKLDSIEFPA